MSYTITPGEWAFKGRIKISSGDAGSDAWRIIPITLDSDGGSANIDLLGLCTDFPNDIEFSDDSYNNLHHWVQVDDTGAAGDPITVHVRIEEDCNPSDVYIRVFAGKAGATSESNGYETFNLFDHFIAQVVEVSFAEVPTSIGDEVWGAGLYAISHTAEYCANQDKTYITFQTSSDGEVTGSAGRGVNYFDHSSKTFGTAIALQGTELSGDLHGSPALCQAFNDFIYVFYGSHQVNYPLFYKKYDPTDTWEYASWSGQIELVDDEMITYPFPIFTNVDGTDYLYLFARWHTGNNRWTQSYKRTSVGGNDAESWGGNVAVVDFGSTDATCSAYAKIIKAPNGDIHIVWIYGLTAYGNIYHIYLKASDGKWYDMGGNCLTDLGKIPLNKADADSGSYKILVDGSGSKCWMDDIGFDDSSNPFILYWYDNGTTAYCKVARWTGSAWSSSTVISSTKFSDMRPFAPGAYASIIVDSPTTWRVCLPSEDLRNILIYKTTNTGSAYALDTSVGRYSDGACGEKLSTYWGYNATKAVINADSELEFLFGQEHHMFAWGSGYDHSSVYIEDYTSKSQWKKTGTVAESSSSEQTINQHDSGIRTRRHVVDQLVTDHSYKESFDVEHAVVFRSKMSTYGNYMLSGFGSDGNWAATVVDAADFVANGTPYTGAWTDDVVGGGANTTDLSWISIAYAIKEVRWIASNKIEFYIDSVLKATHTTQLPHTGSGDTYVQFHNALATGPPTEVIDYVYVRPCVDNEPAFDSIPIFSYLSLITIGDTVTAIKSRNRDSLSSTIIGVTVTASRVWIRSINSHTVNIGNVVYASKSRGFTKLTATTIGNAVSATRALVIGRASIVTIGNAVSAIRSWATATKSALVSIGNVVSASRAVTYTLATATTIGNVASATRAFAHLRTAAITIGNVVSVTLGAVTSRASTVIIGVQVSAIGVFAYLETAAVNIGNAVSATRATEYARTATTVMGVVASATSTIGLVRAATTVIGVAVSAIKSVGTSLRTATVNIDIDPDPTAVVIDVGTAAIDRSLTAAAGYTIILRDNPATASGKITSVEIYPAFNMTGIKVGTFYGSGTSYQCRDFATIGTAAGGSKKTTSGLSIDVMAGDYIGIFWSSGTLNKGSGGTGRWYKLGDQTDGSVDDYTLVDSQLHSLYATGISTTTGRTVAYNRSSTVIDGVAVSATSPEAGETRRSTTTIGVVATATRGLVEYVRSALTTIGVVVYAVKAKGTTLILSTVTIGVAISATRVAKYTRAALTTIGVVAYASKFRNAVRPVTTTIGVAVSASGALTNLRSAITIIGNVVSATRTMKYNRAATVIVGVVASATVSLIGVGIAGITWAVRVYFGETWAQRMYKGITWAQRMYKGDTWTGEA